MALEPSNNAMKVCGITINGEKDEYVCMGGCRFVVGFHGRYVAVVSLQSLDD